MLDPSLFSILLTIAATGHAPADVVEQFDRWERRLRAKVENLHVVPAEAQLTSPCDVVVRFAVSNDGSPRHPVVSQSSCDRYYQRKALSLVRALGSIGAVPSTISKDRHVLLKLSYGALPDAAADRRLTESLETERAAYAGRNRAIIMAAEPSRTIGWKSAER